MSLPDFTTQSALFSTAAQDERSLGPDNRFRLFAQKIYPRLAAARSELVQAYCADNGRPAIEPVLLLGLSVLQFTEGIPDREAAELISMHTGWCFALNVPLGQVCIHPTTLSSFRDRLVAHGQTRLAFSCLLDGLVAEKLVNPRGKQRLDSTQMMGLLSRMSRLECVRETLRLALEELETSSAKFGRPVFWTELQERYLYTKLDYRSEISVLKAKMEQAGVDALRLLDWVQQLSDRSIAQGKQVQLLQRVFEEHFEVKPDKTPVQREAQPAGAVQNPHEPKRTGRPKAAANTRRSMWATRYKSPKRSKRSNCNGANRRKISLRPW